MKYFILLTLFLITTTQAKDVFDVTPQTQKVLDYHKENQEYRHSNASIKSFKFKRYYKDDLIFNVNYHHDEYGFRKYHSTKKINTTKHMILAGGSYTYGHGIKDSNTFAYILDTNFKQYSIFNMGLPGASTSEHIFLWEHFNFRKKITNTNGIYIYTIFNDHLNRTNDNWDYLSWANGNRPTYKKYNGKWKLDSPIQDKLSYKWIQNLKRIGLDELWVKINSFFELLVREKQIEKLTSQLVYLKSLYLEQFPNGKFIVTEMSPFMALSRPKDRRYLIKKLNEEGIHFWENGTISPSDNATEKYFIHSSDRHPNALLNSIYSDFLTKKIKGLDNSSPSSF